MKKITKIFSVADVASDDDIYADDEESDEVVADVPAETASDAMCKERGGSLYC